MSDARLLSESFFQALKTGILKPLLDVVHADRDLILDIRCNKVDIYCKGQVAAHVEPRGNGFEVSADRAFLDQPRSITTQSEASELVLVELPHIKQRIAVHNKGGPSSRRGGLEIEFEQLIIRANNLEPSLNTEYFIVDRQVATGEGADRFDMLAVCWPRGERARSKSLWPALIEVKYSEHGGVELLAEQLQRYHDRFATGIDTFTSDAEGLLRQKIDLGLFSGASPDAIKKLRTLPISKSIGDVRFVVALVDYNPNSKLLRVNELAELPFANQVEVFKLGFGMWEANRWDWRAALTS